MHQENNITHEIFSERMSDIPRSFIREILKVAKQPGMISFARGLPNRDLFPADELRQSCDKVFSKYGPDILQYSNTEGLAELREYIAGRYKSRGVQNVKPENILITSGSQQALDLLARILVNKGDRVVLEEPSYLGAIQALSIYRPEFITIPISKSGMDTGRLKKAASGKIKLMYLIPNFQNPTGISYPEENRREIAEIVRGTGTYLIEDDPYGELRFAGKHEPSFMNFIPENTILLGSFSKTVVPAFRLGWVVVPDSLMEMLVIAKQATDLHTNSFVQFVITEYFRDNDTDKHIIKIVSKYSSQKNAMIASIRKSFPETVSHTDPEGGMFLWVELPANISAMRLFEKAVKKKVCIVPGHPFYIGREDVSTFRLSFSCVDEKAIGKGIKLLAESIIEVQ